MVGSKIVAVLVLGMVGMLVSVVYLVIAVAMGAIGSEVVGMGMVAITSALVQQIMCCTNHTMEAGCIQRCDIQCEFTVAATCGVP